VVGNARGAARVSGRCAFDVAAAIDLVFTAGHASDGFAVGDMLLSENAPASV